MTTDSIVSQYTAKFPQSKALYESAKSIFVSGVTHDARYVMPFPIQITHAQGSHKWDVDGHEHIDYFGGHGGLMLGHAHPSLVNAVTKQIQKGTHYGASHELEIEWAELIRKLIPSAERVEFTNTGSEANMLGIRLARAFTGRDKIVKFQQQFGGMYDPMLVGLSQPWEVPESGGILAADSQSVVVLPINDERILEQTLSHEDVAVVVMEPLGALSGGKGVAPSFHQKLRSLTTQHGTLLLYDEVVSGFRCSPWRLIRPGPA